MSMLNMVAYIIKGIGITFELVPCVIVSTLMVGMIVGILRFANIRIISQIIDIYVTAIRGIPPLVVLMMLYFTANMSSPFLTAFVALTIYHGAYVAEIVRGGLESVPKGQFEAGQSLGLKYMTIMFRIYIPQIMLQIVPTLCGQYILVVKDTTLVSVVGLQDIMWNASELVAVTYDPIRIYFIIGVIYFVICFVVDMIANRIENRFVKSYQAKLQGKGVVNNG
ncbi:amino acid ABC transporter permease [Hornefia butyriciproducens]|uniref:amino acid ABC transporter permease n=1 Tax=Hornefia butyriciproducens TaxID=2652293 RepID=UPI003F897639